MLTFSLSLWGLYGLGVAGLTLPQMVGLTAALLVVTALGVYDDLRGCGAWTKLCFQAGAGLVLYAHGYRIEQLTNPFDYAVTLDAFAVPLTLLWIIVITNAINVIDGLDGLAAGVVLIGVSTLFLISLRFGEAAVFVPCLLLAATTAGFLPLNWPPARIFLGDTGSLSLGLLIGAISLLENRKGTVAVTLLLPIVLMGIPLLDATLAFFRRVRRRQHPFRRDTRHLHHRLLQLGLSPRQVLKLVYGLCLYLGFTAYLISVMPKQQVMVAVVILGIGVTLGVKALQYLESAGTRSSEPR